MPLHGEEAWFKSRSKEQGASSCFSLPSSAQGAGFAGLETASHSSGTFLAPFNIQTLWSIGR